MFFDIFIILFFDFSGVDLVLVEANGKGRINEANRSGILNIGLRI